MVIVAEGEANALVEGTIRFLREVAFTYGISEVTVNRFVAVPKPPVLYSRIEPLILKTAKGTAVLPLKELLEILNDYLQIDDETAFELQEPGPGGRVVALVKCYIGVCAISFEYDAVEAIVRKYFRNIRSS